MTDDEMNRMIQEITMGIPREQSTVPMTLEAIEKWEILTEQIAEIIADGYEVEIPYEIPTVDIVDPAMIIEPVE